MSATLSSFGIRWHLWRCGVRVLGAIGAVVAMTILQVVIVEASGGSASAYDRGVEAFGRGDYSSAREFFEPLARNGDPDAQVFMGYIENEAHHFAASLNWYRLAAEQGSPSAQYNIGMDYQQGTGVKQNYVAAAEWFKRAADIGQPEAQFRLGMLYLKGMGVPQDLLMAYIYFSVAAAAGHFQSGLQRDEVAKSFDQKQLISAQEAARDWTNSHPITFICRSVLENCVKRD